MTGHYSCFLRCIPPSVSSLLHYSVAFNTGCLTVCIVRVKAVPADSCSPVLGSINLAGGRALCRLSSLRHVMLLCCSFLISNSLSQRAELALLQDIGCSGVSCAVVCCVRSAQA